MQSPATLSAQDLLAQARSLTKAQVWEALPALQRTSERIKADIAKAGPQEAIAIYKDCFWRYDDATGKMIRMLSEVEVLPFMLALYLHKGGTEPEAELGMWAKIFKLTLDEVAVD